MEMLCPECMGLLATADGRTARCTVHGGHYQIMYSKDEANLEPATPAAPAGNGTFKVACPACGQRYEGGPEHVGTTIACTTCQLEFEIQAPQAMCSFHPAVAAESACARCGTLVCGTCAFPNPQGGQWCPACAAAVQVPRPGAPGLGASVRRGPAVALAVMCRLHPGVPAVQRCAVCQAPVCSTCDFAFPGGVHVCPACASKPQDGLGKRRKKSLIISYVLAGWSSIGLAVMFSGALAGSVNSKADLEVLGMVIMFVVFVPSIVGTAMAVGTIDRRLSNPASIWVSVIWNAIILTVLMLMTIIGNMS